VVQPISKTINVPENCLFDEFRGLYDMVCDVQLKGCIPFRPNPAAGALLSDDDADGEAAYCRALERECD
jgi:ribonucleoside-diphosphate reductase alpha chain